MDSPGSQENSEQMSQEDSERTIHSDSEARWEFSPQVRIIRKNFIISRAVNGKLSLNKLTSEVQDLQRFLKSEIERVQG